MNSNDPMTLELWSLPMALAWMIWRSDEAVSRAAVLKNDLPDILIKYANDSDFAPQMTGSDAQVKFWAAMRNGLLQAYGVPSGETVRLPIAAAAWDQIDVLHAPGGQRYDDIGSSERTLFVAMRSACRRYFPLPTKPI